MIKSQRKIRGEWYKAIREDSIHKIRSRVTLNRKPETLPDGRVYYPQATGDDLDRIALAIYFATVFYKLMLRLPDIERFRPEWLDKARAMIVYSEEQLWLFAPYLKLPTYEPITFRPKDEEPL